MEGHLRGCDKACRQKKIIVSSNGMFVNKLEISNDRKYFVSTVQFSRGIHELKWKENRMQFSVYNFKTVRVKLSQQ